MDKITSYEECVKYVNLLGWRLFTLHEELINSASYYKNKFRRPDEEDSNWWIYREKVRLLTKVYKTTEVLEYINELFPVFAHISLEDSKMVAFTPDANCGVTDKQVRTTIGRLIAKVMPFISNKYMEELIKDHESELNPEILWASGEELTEMYKKDLAGTAACMSSKDWKVHPTVAYHTDEIKMAYLKKDGKLIARSLVYEPKDGSKKVWIRVYPGDHVLQKHLENLGYERGSFVGAKLNTVKIPNTTNHYAIPYLDSNGNCASNNYSTTALIDNQITVINSKTRDAIVRTFGRDYITDYTAHGSDAYKNVDSSKFVVKCPLSGKEYSILDDHVLVPVYHNGETIKVLKESIPTNYVSAVPYRGYDNVWADPCHVHNVNGNNEIINVQQLENLGFKKLDETLYKVSYWSDRTVTTVSGKIISYVDSVEVYDYDGKVCVTTHYHPSEIKPRQFTRLYNQSYCTKASKFKVTTSGKKFIPGVHDVYTLITGEYSIRRPKVCRHKYGNSYFANTNEEFDAWYEQNKEKLYLDHIKYLLTWDNQRSIAYELLPYGDYLRHTIPSNSKMPIDQFLTAIAQRFNVGSMERKAITNWVAEMTAVEYAY